MADGTAYGSVERPVPLDPFTRITEVHWATTFIAGQVQLRLDVTARSENAVGPGPAYVEPVAIGSITEAAFSYPNGIPIAAWQQWSGKGWSVLRELESNGAPTPPDYTYPLWQWQAIDAFGCKAPFFAYSPGTPGSPLKPTVPGRPAQHFTEQKVNDIVLKMQGFEAGGPYPAPFAGIAAMWRTAKATDVDISIPRAIPVVDDAEVSSFSAAGITASLNGKTFDAIGTGVIEPTERYGRGELWILFKKRKQEVTP